MLMTAIIAVLFTHTTFTGSQVQAETDRAALEQRIASLLQQVSALRQQLARLQQGRSANASSETLYETRFYTGSYEAVYRTSGTVLVPYARTAVRTGDQLLWDAFVEIAGTAFTKKHISEFRVYNDEDARVSAFVEEKPDDTWILAFNREGENSAYIHQSSSVTKLLLHEYAHIVFFNDENIEEAFTDRFWEDRDSRKSDNERFVSEYAATSPTEDLVESFVQFVLYAKPEGDALRDEKVRFFYSYDELVDLRKSLRESERI